MKKQLLLFLLMLLPVVASADDVEIGGIFYNLNSETMQAEVTSNPNFYTNRIVIPPSITFNGITYSVTSIGDHAFDGCTSLTTVTIPGSVKSIGNSAFFGCTGLISVTISNGVTSIGNEAFCACTALHSVTFPNSMTTIGDAAFEGCSGLTSVTIPNSVTSIGNEVFWGCSSLTSVTIPGSVTSIGNYAFNNCYGLNSVTIGYGVTSIGEWAFSLCSGLTSITIPNSVTSIGDRAFFECSSLPSVTIPGCVKNMGSSTFLNCIGLTSVTIGNGVKSIGDGAFYGCSGLTSVTIPNSADWIGSSAFEGCTGLTTVTIGSGLRELFSNAFSKCTKLTDIYCYAPWVLFGGESSFYYTDISHVTLHILTALIDGYKEREPWMYFGAIVGLDGTLPETQKCATPTISYTSQKLTFTCETEGATCLSTITDTDIASYSENVVDLTVAYTITVYATKQGYEDSDVATATLCWIDTEPGPGDITTQVAEVRANPVLITSNGGMLTLTGVPAGTNISVYNLSGQKVGSATATAGTTQVSTTLGNGEVAIVKIGTKSVKVVVR